jgi:hypothetical protein
VSELSLSPVAFFGGAVVHDDCRAAHLRETDCRGCECSADRTSLQSQNEQHLLIERADFGTAVARNWQLIQWLAAKFSYRSRLSNISAFSDL